MRLPRNLSGLALLLLLLTLPAVVQAQFTFVTNNGALTITGYTGPGGAVIIPDTTNGLDRTSAAQCQHIRAVSMGRLEQVRGNVGPVAHAQIREALGLILDIPE